MYSSAVLIMLILFTTNLQNFLILWNWNPLNNSPFLPSSNPHNHFHLPPLWVWILIWGGSHSMCLFVTGLLHLVLLFSCQYSTVLLFIAVSFLILTALLIPVFSFIFLLLLLKGQAFISDHKSNPCSKQNTCKKKKKALFPEFLVSKKNHY